MGTPAPECPHPRAASGNILGRHVPKIRDHLSPLVGITVILYRAGPQHVPTCSLLCRPCPSLATLARAAQQQAHAPHRPVRRLALAPAAPTQQQRPLAASCARPPRSTSFFEQRMCLRAVSRSIQASTPYELPDEDPPAAPLSAAQICSSFGLCVQRPSLPKGLLHGVCLVGGSNIRPPRDKFLRHRRFVQVSALWAHALARFRSRHPRARALMTDIRERLSCSELPHLAAMDSRDGPSQCAVAVWVGAVSVPRTGGCRRRSPS